MLADRRLDVDAIGFEALGDGDPPGVLGEGGSKGFERVARLVIEGTDDLPVLDEPGDGAFREGRDFRAGCALGSKTSLPIQRRRHS